MQQIIKYGTKETTVENSPAVHGVRKSDFPVRIYAEMNFYLEKTEK